MAKDAGKRLLAYETSAGSEALLLQSLLDRSAYGNLHFELMMKVCG